MSIGGCGRERVTSCAFRSGRVVLFEVEELCFSKWKSCVFRSGRVVLSKWKSCGVFFEGEELCFLEVEELSCFGSESVGGVVLSA